LLYLFGASPAVCSSFVQGRSHKLQKLSEGTLYLPHATSLRMGRLGYLSEAQDSLAVSYNGLDSYAAGLQDALTKPYPKYESIGIMNGTDYRQLSTSMLQIENEFYSTIRPKRRIRSGERQLHALRERGVEYVEVRAMDLDPYAAIGIAPTPAASSTSTCCTACSPRAADTKHEIDAVGRNKQAVAARGREPGLNLDRGAHKASLRDWGCEVLRECEPIAQGARRRAERRPREQRAPQRARRRGPRARGRQGPPSARMLDDMRVRHQDSYTAFVLERSLEHRRALLAKPLSAEADARFARAAEARSRNSRETEAADKLLRGLAAAVPPPEALGSSLRAPPARRLAASHEHDRVLLERPADRLGVGAQIPTTRALRSGAQLPSGSRPSPE